MKINENRKDISFLGKADSYRYSHKRNSHDIIKSTNSSKNSKQSKKPLPQVTIDLNSKIRKSINKNLHKNFNKLTINHQSYHSNRNFADKNNNPNNNSNISNSRQLHTLNNTLNKSKISENNLPIHFIQNNTQPLRKQKQKQIELSQRNQRGLSISNYREEISQLRMENQCLREENMTLRKNQEYLIQELREAKQARKLQQKANNLDKQLIKELRNKVIQYGDKIQQLFQQLIYQKQNNNKNKKKHQHQHQHQKLSIQEMQQKQQKDQMPSSYSYRNPKEKQKQKINVKNVNNTKLKLDISKLQKEIKVDVNVDVDQQQQQQQQVDNIILSLNEEQFQNFDSENIKKDMRLRLLNMKQPQRQREPYLSEPYPKNASDSAILIMNKKKNGVFCNYNNNKQNQHDHSNSNSKTNSLKSSKVDQPFLTKPSNNNFKALHQYYIDIQKLGQKAYYQQKNNRLRNQ